MFYLILLALPILGIFPKVKKGRAFNGAFKITMPSPPTYGDRWRSVLAQEIVEWWSAWFVAAIITMVVMSFIDFPLIGVLVFLLAWNWRKTTFGQKQLEYIGWAAEWVYGKKHAPDLFTDLTEYTERMLGGYIFFKGTNPVKAQKALERRLPIASILVKLLSRYIEKQRMP